MKVWDRKNRTVTGETSIFAMTDMVHLLFPAERLSRVYCSATGEEFCPGRDYLHTPGSDVILRPSGSRIPYLGKNELYPPEGALFYPDPEATAVPNFDGRNLRFDAGNFFARMQFEVDYTAVEMRDFSVHLTANSRLPRFKKLLKTPDAPCRIVWLGDSISEGYNASGYLKTVPFQPPFAELTVQELQKHFPARLELINIAVNGYTSRIPLEKDERYLSSSPDLLVIAFGMNDLRNDISDYIANLEKIISRCKARYPLAEYLLVSPMSGNPEWCYTPLAKSREMAAALDEFVKNSPADHALARLTALWECLLEKKSFMDLTGNGVNHPNDYGHRVLAAGVLNALFPEKFKL
ncbi:MAG: SGNH/GDSL hydrolase family protein [Lentisphaeria bacterium]|nr:SGNH/GDSL hydrolase family protein [Lentisphaeria bacterium]